MYRAYSVGLFLSLPAWHKPKSKLKDIFQSAGFFPLISYHYWYWTWVANIIKKVSTRVKLGVKIRKAKVMGGRNSHWILGQLDMTDLTGKKNLEEKL